ncbi:MAG: hypothetical protein E6I86_07775 [Chloroflexi bacterium]|nr:MAG: hypothetical protein E6I86_07775 [Chloroflexota bacterium]
MELGTGSATFGSAASVLISGFPTGVAAVSGGYNHSLAVTVDGSVWAWGSNAFGQLGNGPSASGPSPTQVKGLSGASAIAGAFWHSLAIASGAVYWWGEIDRNGGAYAATRSWTPTLVPLPAAAVAVAGSEGFSIALLSDGTVWAWGYNNNGELGNATLTDSMTPVQVTGLSGIVGISAGGQFGEHSMAVDSNGNVWSWGSNGAGQLGDGTTTNRSAPVRVVGPGGSTALTNIVSVAAGSGHSLALDYLGSVWAWGSNGNGDLGNTSISLSGGSTTPNRVMGAGGTGCSAKS